MGFEGKEEKSIANVAKEEENDDGSDKEQDNNDLVEILRDPSGEIEELTENQWSGFSREGSYRK